jgi:hypothetical protein
MTVTQAAGEEPRRGFEVAVPQEFAVTLGGNVLATRRVRPGTYELALQATGRSGLQRIKTTRLRVVRRPRGAGE